MSQVTDLGALARQRGHAPQGAPPSRWKSRILLPALLLAGVLAIGVYAAQDVLVPPLAVEVVPVVVRSGAESAGTATVQAPGWIEPDPFPIYVSGLADGVIREVPVLEGQTVKAGDVVARLVDEDARLELAAAEGRLAEAAARVSSAKAQVAAAHQEHAYLTERRRAVAATEAQLAQVSGELARLPHLVAAEKARAEELAEEYTRKKKLSAQRAVGELEAVQAQRRAEAQAAVHAATVAQGDVLAARVKELEAELSAAKEMLKLKTAEVRALEEARSALAAAEAGLAQQKAQRDAAALRLERMTIKAPAGGIVMARLKGPGDSIMLNGNMERPAQVLRLYDPARLQVRVDVPLADAARISVDQKAKVVVSVLPDRAFDGTVTRIVHEADIQKNTVQVKVAIHEPAAALKPEMLARVRFLAAAVPGAGARTVMQVFAPEGLIERGADGAAAWVVEGDRAVRRSVTLGESRQGGWVEVTAGLRAGDQVIASGRQDLREGKKIRVSGEAAAMQGGNHGTD